MTIAHIQDGLYSLANDYGTVIYTGSLGQCIEARKQKAKLILVQRRWEQ